MTRNDVFQFFRAVGGGTLGGSLFFVWFSIPAGIRLALTEYPPEGLMLAFAPVAIVAGVTLLASVIFGLPLMAFLRAKGSECRRTYAVVGLICGALIPIVVFIEIITIGVILAVPGMVAGVITGSIWGDYRHDCANPDTPFAPPEESVPETKPNPIHELLH